MKAVVFDFDGTLTKKNNEIWGKMWKAIDACDVDYLLYKKYASGEINYKQWCEEIEKEYIKHGFNEEILYKIANEIQLMDNLDKTLKILKEQGYKLFIISGGVDKIIYNKLGTMVDYFDEIHACEFEFDNNGLLKHIEDTEYDEEGKKIFIDEYCLKNNESPQNITFIGNGDNDEYVYLSGCRTICINPQKKTNYENREIWNIVINDTEDMLDILKYFNIVENIKLNK